MKTRPRGIRKQANLKTIVTTKMRGKAEKKKVSATTKKERSAKPSPRNQSSKIQMSATGSDGPSVDDESNGSIRVYPNFPRTDAGNAELFARGYRNKLRFDHKRSRWMVWRGHWWSLDENELVLQAAKKIARYRLAFSTTIDNSRVAEMEANWAVRSESRARLEAMLKLAQSEHPITDPGTGWDANSWLLGVANGVVDLRTGRLLPGKQSDQITMHTDVSFDPVVRAPRWDQFLREILGGDQELVDYLRRAAGYCLTGDVSEQIIFLAYGTGANGKSTFLDVLRYVLGDYAYNLPFSAFELKARSTIPNELAALSGKRFVTAIETNESAELNEGRIKALTGSDPITARFLYREFFTFDPTAKFWLAFNHKPNVSDDSHGFWRRVRLVPFLKRFESEHADANLLEKLKAEAPGILNWLVQGALEWQKDGLQTPAVVTEASELYREDSDVLKEFIEDRLVIGPSQNARAADLWNEYVAWAAVNHDRPLDRKTLSRKMQIRGFKRIRAGHDRVWTWLGVGLRRDIPAPDLLVDLINPPAGGCGRELANCL